MADADLVELLRSSRNTLLFTGAGISTDSGIPDFQGSGGVWTRRQPVYYQDFMTSHEAGVEHWDFNTRRLGGIRLSQPTGTHLAIVGLERQGHLRIVVTQNIDGLYTNAGTSPDHLFEIHGTNTQIECQSCLERSEPDPHFTSFRDTGEPPLCHCNGFLRPATISFGQNLVKADLDRAFAAAGKADLIVSLGSTLSVYPAASVPFVAVDRGVPYVIINHGQTEHDQHAGVTLRLEGDVQRIFPPAVKQLVTVR